MTTTELIDQQREATRLRAASVRVAIRSRFKDDDTETPEQEIYEEEEL